MTAFISKGAIGAAVLAATLYAAPIAAQDTPPPWQIERFGVTMTLPGDMSIDEDRHRGDRLEFSAIREGETGVELRIGVRVITPAVAETLPVQPGDDGFADFLSQVVNVDLERTRTVMQIGGASFRVYSGTNQHTADDGTELERALFLVSEEPMASGDGLWIAVYSNGLTPEIAQRIEAEFFTSLTLDGAEAGADAPLVLLDGLVRLTPHDGQELAVRRRDRREMVQTGPEGGDAPDVLRTAELLRDPGDEFLRMAEIRLLDLNAITQGQRDGVPVWILEGSGQPRVNGERAEAGVGDPTRLEVVAICPPGEGPVVLGATVGEGPVDPALFDAFALALPDGAASCGAPLNTAMQTLALARQPNVIEGLEIEPAPAMTADETVQETPTQPVEDMVSEIPQPGSGDDAPEMVVEETGSASLFSLSQPDGTVPEGWETWQRFGITIAAPADSEINSDRGTAERMEFLLEQSTPPSEAAISAGFMVASPDIQAQMPPLESEDFLALLSGWAGMPVERLDDTVMLAGSALRAFTAIGQREGGGPLGRVLYLVSDEPLPNGNRPFVVAAAFGTGDATDAVINDILRSLSVADPDDWGRVTQVGFLEGLGSVAIPQGQSVIDVESTIRETTIALGAGAGIDTMIIADRVTTPLAEWLDRRMQRVDSVEQGEVNGEAVRAINGLANFGPDFRPLDASQEVGIRVVLLNRCLADGTRIALTALSTADDVAPDYLTSLLNGATIRLPEDAIDCLDAFDPTAAAALADVTPPDAPAPESPPAPEALVRPPQPPSGVLVTPGTGGSKDPSTPEVFDPEAEAWSTAEAAQSAGAMIAYLQEWPDGAHADAAREWLTARAILAPDASPAAQPAGTPSAMSPQQEAWQRAWAQATPAALWTYLKAFPDGANAAEARAMLTGGSPTAQNPVSPPVPDPEPTPQQGK